MKKNGQLKAVVTFGARDWESNLPLAGGSAERNGYVPLGKNASAGKPKALLRLSDQGLSEVIEGPVDVEETVRDIIDATAAQARIGKIPPDAEVLARWNVPLPEDLPEQDALRFYELTYQFIVRSVPIEHELCGVIEEDELKIWFVPVTKDRRGQMQLSTRGLMTRSAYLDLYEKLGEYLRGELGYPVDIDADDVMFKEMGYSESERKEAVDDRDEMRRTVQETGEKLGEGARDFAKGFASDIRRKFLS